MNDAERLSRVDRRRPASGNWKTMNSRFTKLFTRLVAPLTTIALLVGMVAEHRTYLSEEDFAEYHARAADAINAFPWKIGTWAGIEKPVVQEAQALLKPNCILSRGYQDFDPGADDDRRVSLLIVQCKRSGDMVGHYPRNCYRSIGNEMVVAEPRIWKVGDVSVPLTEYHFKQTKAGQTYWTIVYNFMIVPGRGIVADMEGVKSAAEDYQQRYYGAAQYQLVFHAVPPRQPMPQAQRDEIVSLFLRELLPTIKTLNSGALR
jgi:hypothetical protein